MDNVLNSAAELLILIFLVITFLQSGIDKIIDWKGNLGWLTGHFSKTPLKNIVPLVLGIVLLVEMLAGILCLIGVYQIVAMAKTEVAMYGAIASCVALLMLLFGQRLAKDYDGARTVAVYFIPAIFLVFLLEYY